MIALNDQQKAAIQGMKDFCNSSETMFMLEGSAGTGKTTCIQHLVKEMPNLNFVFCAPTNKATKVLREMGQKEGTVGIQCRTIYSLLGLRVQKDSEYVRVEALAESDAGQYHVVVCDEGSMVNKQLMGFSYEAALNLNVKFIFMGDRYQLPPVGEEESECFAIPNRAVLTKVERHDNQILTLATHIRDCIKNGEYPTIRGDHDENGGVWTTDHRVMHKHIAKAYTSERYMVDPNSCKTIAWRNSTVNGYNEFIRENIYGDSAQEAFVVGERVVATHPIPLLGADGQEFSMVTDEEGTVVECAIMQHPMFEEFKVYHLRVETEFGDIWADCFVIHPDSRKAYDIRLNELASKAKTKKLPWSSFWGFKNEFFHDIRPCHSITAHRSQGSTYRSVFVDVEDILANYNTAEALRCLYVACTRASDILVLKTR